MASTDHDPSDLRREILRTLYLRRAGAFTARYLAATINRRGGTSHTADDVKRELKFLESKGWTGGTPDELGSEVYHSLTPDGTLYCERNELTD